MSGQFDALRLTAGKRRRRLAEPDVPQSDVPEHLQLRCDLPPRCFSAKELARLIDRHPEDIVDVLPAVPDIQDLFLIPLPLAYIAGQIEVGEELHLHLHDAIPLTRVASSRREH